MINLLITIQYHFQYTAKYFSSIYMVDQQKDPVENSIGLMAQYSPDYFDLLLDATLSITESNDNSILCKQICISCLTDSMATLSFFSDAVCMRAYAQLAKLKKITVHVTDIDITQNVNDQQSTDSGIMGIDIYQEEEQLLNGDVLYSITGLIGVLYNKFNQCRDKIPQELIPELNAFFALLLDTTNVNKIVLTMLQYNYPEHLNIYYFLIFLADILSSLCSQIENGAQEDETQDLKMLMDGIMFEMWTVFCYNLKLGTILFMVQPVF